MAIRIANIASQAAQRKLSESSEGLSRTYERLASGQRLNRPSDDAASLAISSALKTGALVIRQGIRNINDGISALNVAEGALNQLSTLVLRMKELAEQSANGVFSTVQRRAIGEEADSLTAEYNRIVNSTTFNGIKLFDPNAQKIVLQTGASASRTLELNFANPLFQPIGDGTFKPLQQYAAGAGAYDAVIGDFNRDGNRDILTSNYGATTVSLLLGNGDGTFQAPSVVIDPPGSGAVEDGDFNGDSITDIVLYAGGLKTYLGNGDGTFTSGALIPGVAMQGTEAGDFDGDGRLDIATVTGLSETLELFYGNGDGTFSAGASIALGGSSWPLTVGDVNNDGKSDLLAYVSNGVGVKVLLGTANRAPVLSATFSSGFNWPTLADLNRDGNLDFVAGTYMNSGNGDGTFSSSVIISNGIGGINFHAEAVDINKDGNLDLIETNNASGQIAVMLGNGDGSFRSPTLTATPPDMEDFLVSDFNKDGVVDVVSLPLWNSGVSNVGVLISNTTLSASLTAPYLYRQEEALSSLETLGSALENIHSSLASAGCARARLETQLGNLRATSETYEAAAARITDADIAQEAANLVRQQILQQTGAAILTQANQQSRLVLDLLKSM